MNIFEKLLKVQTDLKAPNSQFNAFGKYNYRNAEDILEAVKPIQARYGAVTLLTDEIKLVGDRYYVEATAMFIDCESEANITVKASAREEADKKGMDGSQVTGASSSYARKYALNGLFAIDDTKDSDTTNNGNKDEKKPEAKAEEKTEWYKERTMPKAEPKADKPFPEVEEAPMSKRERFIRSILKKEEYIQRLYDKIVKEFDKYSLEDLTEQEFAKVVDMANKFMAKVNK